MYIVGIDIGLKGAIASIDSNKPKDVMIWDMPLIEKTIDIVELKDIMYSLRDSHVFVEKAQPMPKQGVVSMFNYGKTYGIVLGVLSALEIPYTLVTPQAWKKEVLSSMEKDKVASIIRCQQLYPHLKFKKTDHGKAEALLIAYYGETKLRGLKSRGHGE